VENSPRDDSHYDDGANSESETKAKKVKNIWGRVTKRLVGCDGFITGGTQPRATCFFKEAVRTLFAEAIVVKREAGRRGVDPCSKKNPLSWYPAKISLRGGVWYIL